MWSTVKNLCDKNKIIPPRMIIFNNIKVTSTKKIANIANQYFLDKITNLRKKFTTPKFSALNFLTSLIDRNIKLVAFKTYHCRTNIRYTLKS